jgi:hypothetical protein
MQSKAVRRRWVRGLSCASCLLSAFVLMAWLLPGGLELTVQPVDGGQPLFVAPIEPGERFTLHYTHSVDCAPIWEEHSVDRSGTIYIEEERFVMFGAGMGHWRGHGKLTTRGCWQVIEDIHAPVGRGPNGFVLRVGSPSVGHTILFRGKRVNLSRWAPHRAVFVAARPLSGLSCLWRKMFASSEPVLPSDREVVAAEDPGQEH